MKTLLIFIFSLIACISEVYSQEKLGNEQHKVIEIENSFFTGDKHWRGADGAATVDLGKGRVLWLFSDTFIDTLGTGQRTNATIIRNSLAIQEGYEMEKAKKTFYYRGTPEDPKAFFDIPGDTWLWIGHGIMVKGKLLIFFFEEESTTEGFGFKSVGWHMVKIDNPSDDPLQWELKYYKGHHPSDVLVGSSSVLKDERYIYAYGVKESANHKVFLFRYEIDKLLQGDFTGVSFWMIDKWVSEVEDIPEKAALFEGQTEFSVHYQPGLERYIQIQTYGFGNASIGYRMAGQPQGPWSEPVIFYQPKLEEQQEFVYTANAHPELASEGMIITYNINSFDFGKLVNNENIYFPKIITLK